MKIDRQLREQEQWQQEHHQPTREYRIRYTDEKGEIKLFQTTCCSFDYALARFSVKHPDTQAEAVSWD